MFGQPRPSAALAVNAGHFGAGPQTVRRKGPPSPPSLHPSPHTPTCRRRARQKMSNANLELERCIIGFLLDAFVNNIPDFYLDDVVRDFVLPRDVCNLGTRGGNTSGAREAARARAPPRALIFRSTLHTLCTSTQPNIGAPQSQVWECTRPGTVLLAAASSGRTCPCSDRL